MTDRAARSVDVLLPYRRVRQWVLTVPWSRRWDLARHHALVKGVLHEALAVPHGDYAKRSGLPHGRTGSIAVVQRFGSALHLNIHYLAKRLRAALADRHVGDSR